MSFTVDRAILQPVILCAVLAVVIAIFGGCAWNRSLRGGSEHVNIPVKLTLKEKNIGIKDWERITNDDEEIPFTFKALAATDIGDKCAEKKDCSHEHIEYDSDACKIMKINCRDGADLFIIEFDDQGRLYHKEQMERFFTFLKEILSPKSNCSLKPTNDKDESTCFDDVSLIVAVHGWRHGASFDDRNLRELRESLYNAFLFENSSGSHLNPSNKPRKVVGLYVGWRGSVWDEQFLPWPLSHVTTVPALLSFWDRKGAALDVALGSTRELFARLGHLRTEVNKKLVKDKGKRLGREPEWYDTCRKRAGENHECFALRVLILGHSFGSLIIYNAISESILESVSEGIDLDQRDNCAVVSSSYADLIFLINPAFEGARFEPLHQASLNRIQKGCYSKAQAPVLVMVTGTTDWATRGAFPVGRRFSTLFQSTSPEGKGGEVLKRTQKEEHQASFRTVGHIPRYMTHYLDLFPKDHLPPTIDTNMETCLKNEYDHLNKLAMSGKVDLENTIDLLAKKWKQDLALNGQPWPARAFCGLVRVSPAMQEIEESAEDPLDNLLNHSESGGPWDNQLPPKNKEPSERTRDPYTPIWIVRTKDDRIIHSHNGYLNSYMVGFIQQLYRDVLQGNPPGK